MSTANSQFFRQQIESLAELIVARQYQMQPEIWKPYGHPGRSKSVRDTGYHLTYLAEALDANDPALFNEYLAWVKVLFSNLKFPDHVLPTTLDCTRQVLSDHLPDEVSRPLLDILQAGIDSLDIAPVDLPSLIEGNAPIDLLSRRFITALLQGDRHNASQMILEAAGKGTGVKEIYTRVFQRSQREIGRLWQTNQISVAQEHYCTAATQMIMSQLYPYIFTGARKDHRIVAACVGGELHEIGARMVADFFEMEGWDTYFLGSNTPPESIVRAVQERNAEVLALSATMTFHISKVNEVILAVRAACGPDKPRILVGGYPFNLSPDLWQQIGADGYAPDADSAILEAEKVLAL